MRVLVSPDCFTGTLTAVEASHAIREGWLRTNPHDEVHVIPLSDGGPGFLGCVIEALGASNIPVVVKDPLGREIPAEFAILDNQAWIESAQACGLAHLEPDERNPLTTSTYGVGQLIAAAIDAGAQRITIGLGGSGTNDAGAGALAALGAESKSGALDSGGAALASLSDVDMRHALERIADVEIVLATDVDNPLLGLRGATAMFGRQKGADDNDIMILEGALEHFASVLGKRADGKEPAVALGAGAAGGLGYGLMHLGASRVAGIGTVMNMLGIDEQIRNADLVITGEGCLDDQSLHGKVIAGVADRAVAHGKPCLALAGDVRLGKREASTAGIDSAYSMTELAGKQAAMGQPRQVLADLAQRVAKTWGRA